MDKSTDYARPLRQGPKRRRKAKPRARAPSTDSGSEGSYEAETESGTIVLNPAEPTGPPDPQSTTDDQVATDLEIQHNNAYPGSSNTIGSIHQRRWWLSLDRTASGFQLDVNKKDNGDQKGNGRGSSANTWVRSRMAGQGFPFYVYGPEIERSVVTGRLGGDVLDDEGVVFVARRGWRAILN